jgi:hypothetical protein
MKTEKINSYSYFVGDTVVVDEEGCSNLTDGMSKDFKDISYTLDDEEEDEDDSSEEEIK